MHHKALGGRDPPQPARKPHSSTLDPIMGLGLGPEKGKGKEEKRDEKKGGEDRIGWEDMGRRSSHYCKQSLPLLTRPFGRCQSCATKKAFQM